MLLLLLLLSSLLLPPLLLLFFWKISKAQRAFLGWYSRIFGDILFHKDSVHQIIIFPKNSLEYLPYLETFLNIYSKPHNLIFFPDISSVSTNRTQYEIESQLFLPKSGNILARNLVYKELQWRYEQESLLDILLSARWRLRTRLIFLKKHNKFSVLQKNLSNRFWDPSGPKSFCTI